MEPHRDNGVSQVEYEAGRGEAALHGVWHFIETRDLRLMRRVQAWMPPHWVRLWAVAATRAGDGWLWGAVGIALLLSDDPERYTAALTATSAILAGIALFQAVKRLTGRRRPNEIEPHCWATVLPPDAFSFPSGHTITAFTAAMSLSLFYPHLAGLLFFFAASIAASRILLGMHFLSDVVVGAGIGTTLGWLAHHLAR